MFNPLYLLTLLPTWLVGMYLLRLLRKESEKRQQHSPVAITVRGERDQS